MIREIYFGSQYNKLNNNMEFILTCPNGKQIDMSNDVLRQMSGEITKSEVEERIDFYTKTNNNEKDSNN